MVKILITNATIVTMSIKTDLVIRDGYLYIDGGVIKALGSGKVPEEYQYAEYLIDGKGRIVIPGLASGLTLITPYIIRYEVTNLEDPKIKDLISVMSRDDVYYTSILAFTEMVKRGITASLVVDTYLDSVARAANEVGIRVVLAPGIDCLFTQDDAVHSLKLIMNRYHGKVPNVSGGIAVCKENSISEAIELANNYGIRPFLLGVKFDENTMKKYTIGGVSLINSVPEVLTNNLKTIYTEGFLNMWKAPSGIGLGVRASYNINDLMKRLLLMNVDIFDVLASGTIWGYEALGLSFSNAIEVNKPCDVVILNASEPPGWPVPRKVESLFKAVVEGTIPVETVIIADNIVIDCGETVTVGSDIIRKATNKLSDLIKK